MTRRVRVVVLGAGLAGLAALLGWSIAGLPAFGAYRGPYGYALNKLVVPLRHTSNVVMGATFDVRSIDTLGETFMLYAAVLGITMLLRAAEERGAADAKRRRPGLEALRLVGAVGTAGCLLVGFWLVSFGYVTPGGGFQGGVVLASAVLLVYLVGSHVDYRPFRNESILDPLEALGAAGYVIIGLAALVAGTSFLTNLLPPGRVGTLLSGGSIPFLSWAVGLEVAGANLVLFGDFLATYVAPLAREDAE